MPGVSAILTAAGESRRMGRPKPLLAWRGTTLVEHQISALFDGGAAEVVVVVGHEADAVAAQVAHTGARCVPNPDYLQGKTTSIKSGLSAISADADAIMLLAVDQPRTASIVSAVVRAHIAGDALITSPRYEGHGGHPLIFAASLRGELSRITEERQGIREVFQAHRNSVQEYALDDPMIRLDLNTPEAYEAALRRYGGGV
ncbi:MAG: nucleotidyltransferase family protein [Chloroflexi bacterium]|nr:nucleotidyltransferase family protein [Chloroflexota bacterium]